MSTVVFSDRVVAMAENALASVDALEAFEMANMLACASYRDFLAGGSESDAIEAQLYTDIANYIESNYF